MNADAGNRFVRALASGETILLDGGFATELESQGHDITHKLWSARMLVENPQAIVDAHRAYLGAGADLILTATYQASRKTMQDAGIDAEAADKYIASSVDLANQAIDEYLQESQTGKERPLLGASMGPYGSCQYDGSEYTGAYKGDADDIRDYHAPRIGVLDDCDTDVLAVETIPNGTEAEVLVDLLQDRKTPAWVSFCCRDHEHLSDGTPLRDAAGLFANHPGVVALGINCTSPEYVTSLIATLTDVAPAKAIVVYPNSGETYESRTNTWHGTVSPVECADASVEWRNAGATIIGGCCRMGPQHIAAMREQLGRE